MEATAVNKSISVVFSEDEAFVLLEWLHRVNMKGHSSLFQDQAEERVLFDLEAVLEGLIPETFADDYTNFLANARERIRDKE
jgi:hypothetical protein